MEVLRTVGSVMGCIKMVVDLIDTSTKRGAELAAGLDWVKEDLDLIKARLVEDKELHRQPVMQVKLQELAYRIDDFVHDLWIPGPFGGIVLSATGLDRRVKDTTSINSFKERAKRLLEELDKRSQGTKSDDSKTPPVCSSSAGSPSYAPEKDLVGIAKPKKEIVDLLSPGDGSLRVISIAGRSGVGKTALARALYQDEDVVDKFDYKAWVVPSNNSSADILNKIYLEPVRRSTAEDLQHFSKRILQVLHLAPAFEKNKRYLVFVDDVQRGTACKDIKDAFRENVMDSRIIMTTSVPSIPWECSSGSYVYIMQGLDQENSRKLFEEIVRRKAGYSAQDHYFLGDKDVNIILDKCDGFPMALISAANFLHRKGPNPRTVNFEQVSEELMNFLASSESDFEQYKRRNGNETTSVEMRRALVEPYENLLNNGEKDCLLYVSIFPSGHQINSKSLVRILIAEGLGPGDPHIMKDSEFVIRDVQECLRMLMDQHMIEPVPIRSNCNAAKRCRVHSIMLQFTIRKAVSRNLVSLIHNDEFLYNSAASVRRLTIQSSSDARRSGHPEKMVLSVLRSLAIFKSGIVNFEECKVLRVLNLEGCCGLTEKDLDNICGLPFLKYLSLRKTDIQELPEKVKDLLCLETLDTRDTVVIKLPVEVIMLPRFAYLFGKFELTNVDKNMKELNKFFKGNKSKLHTLGGIAVHETEILEIVLLVVQHARKLRKVKVWYRDTPISTGPVTTSTPAVGCTPEPIRRGGTHILNHSRLFKRKPSAGPAANPTSKKQDPTPANSTPVAGGTPGLPCAGPLAESSSNAQDPAPATSTPVANGTLEPIPSARTRGLLKNMLNHLGLLSKRKRSADPSTDPSINTPDPAPATPTPIAGGTPGHPSAGPSADSSSNTTDPAPATSTPLASDTPELIHCVSRLTETLKNYPITLGSISIDFNGVSNTFLDFLQINSTISSIKLRRGQGILPRPEHLGKVSNLKKLHLFSTGLESDELGALQHLKCLQYLKLEEEGHGLWDSVFHVKAGGFISLIWLCFESSNSKHPPLKIDERVKTPLNSLLLLCKESHPRVDGMSHLAKLNEVILHPSATDNEVTAWKEEAKKHINWPYVEKKQD